MTKRWRREVVIFRKKVQNISAYLLKKKIPTFCFGFVFYSRHLPQIACSVTRNRIEVSFQFYSIWRIWTKHATWVQIPQVIFPYMEAVLRQLRKIICERRGSNTAFPHIYFYGHYSSKIFEMHYLFALLSQ